jgi:hypothetical protein
MELPHKLGSVWLIPTIKLLKIQFNSSHTLDLKNFKSPSLNHTLFQQYQDAPKFPYKF